ncbi:Uncharacterised protein [Mycobacteroides abscessus subsp. abscessus]|nr:Uncharacterised protein [Mycobacteroides abscessus subsp. abscessus]
MHKSANIFGKPSATAAQPQLELNGVMRGAHSYGEVAGADRRQSRTNENEYEKGASCRIVPIVSARSSTASRLTSAEDSKTC